ncbi:unnamed protein product [Ceutorhynchus assimilis]|uniref:ubiquitinyl hydrolase 1 n=1 Tax=Ceutorhynchus assimilis TaxID=467358 RepID=A0A9N9QNJ7_9CUCU|nr:unnamed protein product [Ceutorhynchus assimilis]
MTILPNNTIANRHSEEAKTTQTKSDNNDGSPTRTYRHRKRHREHKHEPKRDKISPKKEFDNNQINPQEEPSNTGYNSEDEYDLSCKDKLEEWQKKDESFSQALSNLGWQIKPINEDGACLFRSIADQIYNNQELHFKVRQECMDYIVRNRARFEPYITEDFGKYVARKRQWFVHGNHLEIQAMSEYYNRTIEVYCYKIQPINIFNFSPHSHKPIRLSYHRMCHYNSIIDQLLIEQTMFEDKLKATDWEATNEEIEEQTARESYRQYLQDNNGKKDDFDQIMAKVLAESQQTYLDELRNKGPSTSYNNNN